MTAISANIRDSLGEALEGYIMVTLDTALIDRDSLHLPKPARVDLVDGTALFNLEPSDLLGIPYHFRVFTPLEQDTVDENGDPVVELVDTEIYSFSARVPLDSGTIDFKDLAIATGIRFDVQDSSLLTLARYLYLNDEFWDYLITRVWVHKGEYDPATVYKRGDVVTYLGSGYQYVSDIQTVGSLPTTDNWRLLVAGT